LCGLMGRRESIPNPIIAPLRTVGIRGGKMGCHFSFHRWMAERVVDVKGW